MTRNRVYPLLIGGLFVLAFVAGATRADDWTRFRGPNGTGRSDTAFNEPITTKDWLWRVDLSGIGHSSPAVHGGRVYVTSADPQTGKRSVQCFTAADGNLVWQHEEAFASFKQHPDNSFASASPAVDDLGVYLIWSTPEHHAVMSLGLDGKPRWSRDLGRFVSQHGTGASPIVVGELVIANCDAEGGDSFVAALDRKTGEVKWKLDRLTKDKTAMSTPCLFQPKDGPPQLILTNKATGITSVDPPTGKVNWEMPDVLPMRPVGSPVTAGDVIISACGDGTTKREVVAVRYARTGAVPQVAWHLDKTLAAYVPTPIVKGELLFLWSDDGRVSCVKAATGQKVWSEQVGGAYYGSPVCAGDTLWAMSRRGRLVGVAAADHFKRVGEFDLGEASHATPAIADGRMFLRTQSHLICVGKKPQSAAAR